mgnify:CR=1 FL=1
MNNDIFCKNVITIDIDRFMLNSGIERLSRTLNREKRKDIKKGIYEYKRNLKISELTMVKLEIKQRIENFKIGIKTKLIDIAYDKKMLGIDKKCWAELVMYQLGYIKWNEVYEANKCGYCGACMDEETKYRHGQAGGDARC